MLPNEKAPGNRDQMSAWLGNRGGAEVPFMPTCRRLKAPERPPANLLRVLSAPGSEIRDERAPPRCSQR